MCQTRTTTSDLPFYDIFVMQKVPFSQISGDVIACDLWFAPPPPPSNQKSWLRLWLECAKDKRLNSGVARGGGGRGSPRVTPFVCFFSFETENPMIGRQRPFFFFVFTYILVDKGCHHEIPPWLPPFLATPLRVKNV